MKGRKGNESRDVAIFLAREHSGCSLKKMGDYFGGITAAGVSVAHKRIQKLKEENRKLRKRVEQLAGELRNR